MWLTPNFHILILFLGGAHARLPHPRTFCHLHLGVAYARFPHLLLHLGDGLSSDITVLVEPMRAAERAAVGTRNMVNGTNMAQSQ